jgi:putative transposase
MRKTMVEKDHPQLSIRAQCELLGVNRNRLKTRARKCWQPKPIHHEMMALIKMAHAKDPTMGARQLRNILKRNGYRTSRWTVRMMMKYLGLRAIYCQPRTTVPAPENPTYPYLLRELEVSRPDEVWATDITYIPWRHGYVYLTAILDWKTRAVLAWKLSNTMDVSFCLDALNQALGVAGKAPEILNTDQGSQFSGVEWLSAVESLGTKVSMDGKGRWQDNVLIERLWRSVKHEWVLLHQYDTLPELEALIGEWIDRYNRWRPHAANHGQPPWQAYRGVAPVLERDLLPPEGAASEICCLSASASSQQISRVAA